MFNGLSTVLEPSVIWFLQEECVLQIGSDCSLITLFVLILLFK